MGLFDVVTDFVADVAGDGLDLAHSDWGDAASWVSDQVESFGGGGLLGGLDLDDAWGAAGQMVTTVTSGADSDAIWDWAGSAIDEVSGTGFGTHLTGALDGSKGGLFSTVTNALDDPGSLLGTATDLVGGQFGEVNWLEDAAEVASGVLDGSGWSGIEDGAGGVLGSALGEIGEWGGLEAVTDQLGSMGLPDDVLDIGGKLADGFDISDVVQFAESAGGAGVSEILETVGGLGDQDLSELGEHLLGAAGVDLPDSFDGLVSALDGGGVQDLLGELGGERLGGLMGSLSETGLGELVDKAIDGGSVSSLVEGLGGSGLAGIAGKLDGGQVDAIVNGLSEDGVRTLLGQTLKGTASAAPVEAADAFDDVLGATADLAPTETLSEHDGDLVQPNEVHDSLAEPAVEVAEFDSAFDENLDPVLSESFEDPVIEDRVVADPLVDDSPVEALVEPVPDEFEEAVAVADEFEESFTDDLFGDLE